MQGRRSSDGRGRRLSGDAKASAALGKGLIVIIAVIAVAAVAVTAAGGIGGDSSEDSGVRAISYDLGGCTNSDSNPSEYTEGTPVDIGEPTAPDGQLFIGWYTDSEHTQEFEGIDEDTRGDITLYAYVIPDMTGQEITMDISGTFTVSETAADVAGTVTVEYLSFSEEKKMFLVKTTTEYSYTYNGETVSYSDYGFEWELFSDPEDSLDDAEYVTEEGTEEIDCSGTAVSCTVYSFTADGLEWEMWVGSDAIPYKITAAGTTDDGTVVDLTFTYSGTADSPTTVSETVGVTAIVSDGISVTGAGEYSLGDSAALTATATDTEFSGWYAMDADTMELELLSSDATYTIDVAGEDTTLFALSTAAFGTAFDFSGTAGEAVAISDDRVSGENTWLFLPLEYTSAGDEIQGVEGNSLSYAFSDAGIYLYAAEPSSGSYIGYCGTVFVDGTFAIDYTWKDYDYTSHTLTVEIYFSELWEEDQYPPAQRWCFTGNTEHNTYFVDYGSKTIQSLADSFDAYFTDYCSGWTELQQDEYVLSFVQWLDYEYDSDTSGYGEYWRFATETLYLGYGDCEDTSILYCAIMKALGRDGCLIVLPGHCMSGIAVSDSSCVTELTDGDAYYYTDSDTGVNYYTCETTGWGWGVGWISSSYTGEDATHTLYVVS